MANQRQLVLQCFKNLHRTCQSVFRNDAATLQAMRLKINEEFVKHKKVTNEKSIKELLKTGDEAVAFLKESVVQCEQVEEQRYRVVVRPELLFDEVPYRDMPDEFIQRTSKRPRCKELTKDS